MAASYDELDLRARLLADAIRYERQRREAERDGDREAATEARRRREQAEIGLDSLTSDREVVAA